MARSTEGPPPARAAVPRDASTRRWRVPLPLRWKAIGAFLAVALAPVGLFVVTTLRGYGKTVRENEQRMQLLVVRDVASDAEGHLVAVESDVRAVAAAVAIASDGDGGEAPLLAAVRGVIASRPGLSGVRLEVPSAGVSVPFVKEGHDERTLPTSTEALRSEADERGVGITLDGPRAIVVVPVTLGKIPGGDGPSAAGGRGPGAPRGYVVAPLWVAALERDLATAIERNGAGGPATRAVLVDAERRLVASYPAQPRPPSGPGHDASVLPVWSLLGSPHASATVDFGAAGVFQEDGEGRLGTIHASASRRWTAAISRPEGVALAEFHAVRRLALWGTLGVTALAVGLAVAAARAVTRPVLEVASHARLIGARRWGELRPLRPRADELGALGVAVETMARDLQVSEAQVEREAKLRGDLSRFLGAELVDAIVRGEHSLELGGERRVVTVLFADVVAFTPIAERGEPEVVVAILNELFTILSEVVFRHGGTVDKFVGDSIMAVFGAPVRVDDHAERALAAAEDMIQFTETAADEWRARYGLEVEIGIGVNSGEVIVGNIGSKKRMEYTVIGDAVNVAARLEAIAAAGQILVGESTAELVGDAVPLRRLGERTLLGRADATVIHEVA